MNKTHNNSDFQGIKRNDLLLSSEGLLTTQKESNIIQAYAPYGILNTQLFRQFIGGTGSITNIDNKITTSATNANDFAVIRSAKIIKYRPGFQSIAEVNGYFDENGSNNDLQFMGVGSALSDIYVCINQGEFALRYSKDGVLHKHKFTITAAATGAENATITLNGINYIVPLTNASGDIDFTAYEISKFDYGVWNTEHIGTDVFFIGADVGLRNGTYNFTSATATTTNTNIKDGAPLTTTYINRSEFNGEAKDIFINPYVFNMYLIKYGWFGSSDIEWLILDSQTNTFMKLHTEKFVNKSRSFNITNPNMYLQSGIFKFPTAPSGLLSNVISGFRGSILGKIDFSLNPNYSVQSTKTIPAGVETNILVLQPRLNINGFTNQSELIINSLNVACDGNRAVNIKIIKNPDTISGGLTTDYTDYEYVNETESTALVDKTSTTFTGGNILNNYVIEKTGSININLTSSKLNIGFNESLLITATSVQTSIVNCSVNFIDDL